MPNNIIGPSGGGGANQAKVDAIMAIIRNHLPRVTAGAVVTAELVRQIKAILLMHATKVAGVLMGGSLIVLVPALTIVLINAVGFTASGVAAGSLAALWQSAVFGGLTSGIFSSLQSIGATAVIAPPVALGLAGAALCIGGGYLIYKQWFEQRGSSSSPPTDEDDDGSDGPSAMNTVARRSTGFNFFTMLGSTKDKAD